MDSEEHNIDNTDIEHTDHEIENSEDVEVTKRKVRKSLALNKRKSLLSPKVTSPDNTQTVKGRPEKKIWEKRKPLEDKEIPKTPEIALKPEADNSTAELKDALKSESKAALKDESRIQVDSLVNNLPKVSESVSQLPIDTGMDPRKFDTYVPHSDSSDDQLSDTAWGDTDQSFPKISYGDQMETTPHAHLDALVDRIVGGGTFSAFPSEATFQTGHRMSVYDAVEAHLLSQGKKTFLFRTVVVAYHEESTKDLITWHSKCIEHINSICYDELATGFFLIYPRYFVHILEGSEEVLSRFLIEYAEEFEKAKQETAPVQGEENKTKFSSLKSRVIGFFNIRERFLERWVYEKTKPYNRRTHKGPFRKRLFEFLKSSFIMCAAVGRLPENHPLLTVKVAQVNKKDDGTPTEEDRIKGKEVLAVEYIQRMREIAQWMPSKATLVDIMKRKKSRKIQLKSPKEFMRDYWNLPPLILTSETDWPIPCRIAPYD